MAEAVKTDVAAKKNVAASSSAGVIILQWLTYAFWGWTLLSLVWLVFIVLANFMTSQDTSDMVPYAIAAALVLLPLSLVCDIFYSRHEPARKTGASMVVMVIHAVIFALFGIGMLISAVLTLVQILIGASSSGGEEFQQVWVWTALLSTAIYALTFLRTLNPSPKLRLAWVFPGVMALLVGLFIVLGFVGPVAQASITRDDRDIESSLGSVSHAVDQYARTNKKLPATLGDVTLRGKAKDIVERGFVTYTPEGKAPEEVLDAPKDDGNQGVSTMIYRLSEYRYQLCVNYKKADTRSSSAYESYDDDGGEYESTVSTYGHPAGNVCYKLKVNI